MFAFRKTLNYGFISLCVLLVGICGFYLVSQHRIEENLTNIINQENERISSWIRIANLSDKAKSTFHKLIIERNATIEPVIEEVDVLLAETRRFNSSVYEIDRRNAEKIIFSGRKLKNALFGYKREVADGYYGTSALIMDKMVIEKADSIAELAHKALADIFVFIKARNKNVLNQFHQLNFLLVPLFLIFIFLIFVIVFIMKNMAGRFINVFIQEMEKLSKGELSSRISGSYGRDLDKLIMSFNQVVSDWEAAEGKTHRAHQILSRITDGLEEEIFLLAPDRKIIWANKKVFESRNLPMNDIIGRYCYEIMHGLSSPCRAGDCLTYLHPGQECCPFNKAEESRQLSTVVQVQRDKQGEVFYAECSVLPLLSQEGSVEEYIHITRNISKRIKMEEELKSNILTLTETQVNLRRKMRDLEKFYKITVDRELKMTELKKKIVELENAASGQKDK